MTAPAPAWLSELFPTAVVDVGWDEAPPSGISREGAYRRLVEDWATLRRARALLAADRKRRDLEWAVVAPDHARLRSKAEDALRRVADENAPTGGARRVQARSRRASGD